MPGSFVYSNVMTYEKLKLAKARFQSQRYEARSKRNIIWTLTFDEWLNIWQISGHWHERGSSAGKYCMSRYGDTGPYSVNNVFIQLHSNNIRDGHKGKPKGPWTEERKRKHSLARLGVKRGPYKQKSPN